MTSTRLVALALLTSALTLTTAVAQPVITLDQAIATSLANHPDLRIAQLAIDDSQQLVMLAWAEVMPTVTSSVNYTRSIELPVNFLPGEFFGGAPGSLVPIKFGADNSWQGGFTVNQTLFRGDAIVAVSSGSVYRLAARENERATAQRTVTATRSAYYAVLAAQAQLTLADATIARLRTNLDENRARAAAGLLDEYDVLRLEVQLANELPKQAEASDALAAAYRALNLAMGLPVDTPFKVKGNLATLDVFAISPDAENAELMSVDRQVPVVPLQEVDLAAHRGDLRSLDVQRRLKDREILATKTEFLPNITASYNRQWSDAFNGDVGMPDNWNRFQTISINASLPLFNGMRRLTNMKRAQIERRTLDEQIRHAEQGAKHELTSSWQRLQRIFETATSRRQAVDQARRGYDIALARYRNGVATQLDVNDAQYQYQLAELNYALMVFDYLSAKAQYDQSRGVVPFVDTQRN